MRTNPDSRSQYSRERIDPCAANLPCMGMDDRTRLQAQRARLENQLLAIEHEVEALMPDAGEEHRMQLTASLGQHLAELGQVNASLSGMRGPAASTQPPAQGD